MRVPGSKFLVTVVLASPLALHAQATAKTAPNAAAPATPATKTAKTPLTITKKPPEMLLNMSIQDGMLSVDGMIAKVHLDYKVDDAEFFYFYVPGEGTAVVSRFSTPDSIEVKDAFHGNVLAFSTGGHDFQLENGGPLVTRGSTSAYVKLDRDQNAKTLGRYPMMGYGTMPQAPYVWPGALPLAHSNGDWGNGVQGPPVPSYMLPARQSVSVSNVPAQQPEKK
jgi:hypothetical protein